MGTQARFIEHYEEPAEKEYFTIGSVVTNATVAGGPITVAVSADSMNSWADDMGGTQFGSRPRATETFILPNRDEYRIISKNEDVVPHQLVIQPTLKSINAAGKIVAGVSCYIIGPIKAEATGQVKGLTSRYYRYTNTFAIVDETDMTSGTAMTVKSPFAPIPGKPSYFYLKGFHDAETRHERSKGLRAVHGRTFDNASDFSQKFNKTFPFKGTEGLLQFATTYGMDDPFDNLGSITLDDEFATVNYFADLQLPYGDLITMQGSDRGALSDKLLKDFVDNSVVSYVGDEYMGNALAAARMDAPQYDAKKLFVSFGFKGYNYNGYNVLFTGLNELNNSTPGFNFKSWAITVPMGLFQNKKTDDMTPIMGYEYKNNPEIGYDRENEIWHIGGAGPASIVNKCSEFDVKESFIRSEFGTHFSHGQWYHVSRPANVPA